MLVIAVDLRIGKSTAGGPGDIMPATLACGGPTMTIALACPGCAQTVPVTHEMAGKRTACPQCRLELTLPRGLVELPTHEPEPPPAEVRRSRHAWVWPWVTGFGIVFLGFA